jgi:5-amino-6-(5-phospho-D-ribitylamino)uracil phosphatase
VGEELLARVSRAGHLPFISTFDGARDRVYYTAADNEGAAWYVRDRIAAQDERLRRVDDLAGTLTEHVVCLTVIDRWERIDDLVASISETFAGQVILETYENRYSRGWHWVTVHDRRATKGQALQVLMDQEGLADRELVVFGDGANDLSMFRLADRALAMANALDEVKAAATAVIGPNTEDSVARTIRDDWLRASGS